MTAAIPGRFTNPGMSKEGERHCPLAVASMVAGACNHPNVPSIHFSFTIRPNHLRRPPGPNGSVT